MKSWVLGAILLSLASGINTTAIANPSDAENENSAPPTPKGEIRDDDLMIRHEFAGQCRRTTRTVDIYTMPVAAHGSDRVTVLPANSRLRLTGWGGYGWVEINSPVEGYVIARHLSFCSGTARTAPATTNSALSISPDTDTCRIALRDLAIRDRLGPGSRSIGGVPGGTPMTLTGSAELDRSTQRLWLEISAPTPGWVSGGRGGASNVRKCN